MRLAIHLMAPLGANDEMMIWSLVIFFYFFYVSKAGFFSGDSPFLVLGILNLDSHGRTDDAIIIKVREHFFKVAKNIGQILRISLKIDFCLKTLF